MKLVVAGGTGWLGSALARSLAAEGHEVVVLARAIPARPSAGRLVRWDGRTLGPWATETDGADAVLNFTGQSIAARRWTPARKHELVASRLDPTQALVQAMRAARRPPRVLVNASAVGYYGDRGEVPLTEAEGPGDDFLARLVVQWEEAAAQARASGARVALLRMAPVLAPGGELLPRFVLPFRLFVGGPIGSRRQWFPWVHLDDLLGLTRLALTDDRLDGAINVAAPHQVRMGEFAATLGRVLGRPSWVRVPPMALRLLFGELGEALGSSLRVVPARAHELGYRFQQPVLEPALRQALGC